MGDHATDTKIATKFDTPQEARTPDLNVQRSFEARITTMEGNNELVFPGSLDPAFLLFLSLLSQSGSEIVEKKLLMS